MSGKENTFAAIIASIPLKNSTSCGFDCQRSSLY